MVVVLNFHSSQLRFARSVIPIGVGMSFLKIKALCVAHKHIESACYEHPIRSTSTKVGHAVKVLDDCVQP